MSGCRLYIESLQCARYIVLLLFQGFSCPSAAARLPLSTFTALSCSLLLVGFSSALPSVFLQLTSAALKPWPTLNDSVMFIQGIIIENHFSHSRVKVAMSRPHQENCRVPFLTCYDDSLRHMPEQVALRSQSSIQSGLRNCQSVTISSGAVDRFAIKI